MTNSNPDTPPEVLPVVAVAPPPNDNRRRLRDLLSIPERDRTDEQWDEIIELEIQLAPGNRISGNEQGGQDRPPMFQNKPAGTGQAKNTALVVTIQAAIIVIIIVDRARTSRRPAGIPPEYLV